MHTLLFATFTLCSLLAAVPKGASSKQSADRLFEKELYEEALKEYTSLLRTGPPENRLHALFRAAESEVLLFRYGEAAQRLLREPLPENVLWKARFLLLRAEVGREYLKQYGAFAQQDKELGSQDVTRKTPQQWHQFISESYAALWPLRQELLGIKLSTEASYLEVKDTDLERIPTLWDFAVLRWTQYLLDEIPSDRARVKASQLFVDTFAHPLSTDDPPVLQAASLFEETSRLAGEGRWVAKELWRLERWRLLYRYAEKWDSKDKKVSPLGLATRLESLGFREGRAKAELLADIASLQHQGEQWDKAAQTCRKLEREWPKSLAAFRCRTLRASIEQPELILSTSPVPPPGKKSVRAQARNLKELFFRLYPTDEKELLALAGASSKHDWTALRHLNAPAVSSFLTKRAQQIWTTTVPRPEKAHHMSSVETETPEPLGPGLFVVLASSDPDFTKGKALVQAAILNVTHLMLVGSAASVTDKEGHSYQLYTLNGVTGRPIDGTEVEALLRTDWGAAQHLHRQTDSEGRATLRLGDKGRHHSLDPLAKDGRHLAFWQRPLFLSDEFSPPFQLFLETDRPIYRPGQKLTLKITVIKRLPQGWQVADRGEKIELEARDPNSQEFFKKKLELSAMGSATVTIEVPSRLLGTYSVHASLLTKGQRFHAYHSFLVEEYKRPDFEVTLAESQGAWRYGKPAIVEGNVSYYFGAPVPKAVVRYRVLREVYIPWFCWWWPTPQRGPEEVASGRLTADELGRFSFRFTPEPSPEIDTADPPPSRFRVLIEARDTGGRTIGAERTYQASAKSYIADVQFSTGFLRSNEAGAFRIRFVNANDEPVSAKGEFEVFSLTEKPKGEAPSADSRSLDKLYQDVPNGPLRGKGNFSTGTDLVSVPLPTLPSGLYRLQIESRDLWGERVRASRIFVVLDPKEEAVTLSVPELTLTEFTSYTVGETASVFLGSSEVKEAIFVEVWHGTRLLQSFVQRGGIRKISLPIRQEHRGGLTVRWFGAQDFRLRQGKVRLEIPWTDRELKIAMRTPERLKPGEKVQWEINVRDYAGQPADGEATLKVFDRSLEYYAKDSGHWTDSLYPPSRDPLALESSFFRFLASSLPFEPSWLESLLDLPRQQSARERELPALRSQRSRAGYSGRAIHLRTARPEAAALDGAAEKGAAVADMMMSENPLAAGNAPTEPVLAARRDFSETAFFGPNIPIRQGKGSVSFTMPEQLTSWKIRGAVLTSDVKRGTVEALAATRKPLMARVEVPRFLREQDEVTLKAFIQNDTEQALKTDLTFVVEEVGKTVPYAEATLEKILIDAGKIHELNLAIKAPNRTTRFHVRATARSQSLVDSEERELPVFPSRERLVASAFGSLVDNHSTRLEVRLPSANAQVESVHLQLDPQITVLILNALPQLVRSPYDGTDQWVSRFIPLSIVEAFFQKHPTVKEAVKALPQRTTLTPNWDRTDPRRLVELMETPWSVLSQGLSAESAVDLLDPKIVEKEKKEALEALRLRQLPSGAFPWFSGGKEDLYMTLYVLSAFAEGIDYGLTPPDPLASRAYDYVARKLSKRVKPQTEDVAFLLYAAYTLTAFNDYPWGKSALALAKTWMAFADKHSRAMTPFGKSYAARVYWRLGQKEKAKHYLERAMSGAQEDPITGLYWAPEKISWLWYNDSVEKHAFILRTLLAINPTDKRAEGLLKWLLFNRKGNEWRSARASSQAIYALLDWMKSRGTLERPQSIVFRWGSRKETISLEPQSVPPTLRWVEQGDQSPLVATLEKTGPAMAFASLTALMTTESGPAASEGGLIRIDRKVLLRQKDRKGYKLKPLAEGERVRVGDELEVHIPIQTRHAFEYVHVKAPRGAGFEAETLLSGWAWDLLPRYEEVRDSLNNFFIPWLPHGEYVLRYRIRATSAGTFRFGSVVLQSMFSPEMNSYSKGLTLVVEP